MKVDRNGQATPMTHEIYAKIRRSTRLPQHRMLLDLAYYTGERWGAVLQLRTADVYDGLGNPRRTIVYRCRTTKSRATREVPVHPDLAIALQSYQVGELQEPLFGFTMSAADKQFRQAIARAGLEHLGLSTYSTRRGFITQLSRRGIAVRVIQQLTGHKTLSSLQRYIEVTDAELSSAIAAVGR